MLRLQPNQTSFHTPLYDKIPENHILKVIDGTVDFSFINELLKDTYSKHMGRPAKEPELMCKLLFLQHLYNLSDERVIEEASLNLAHMYFLHLNPEDKLPDKSLLAKFRCHRLSGITLDSIITEIVRQCVEQKIIEGGSVSIDSTHIAANTFQNTAERLMKKIARKVIVYHQEADEDFASKYIEPDYESIEDYKEAKKIMRTYVDGVIEEVEALKPSAKTQTVINDAKKIFADPKFMLQKGARSLIDKDARVGRKSKSKRFYGYKTEFVMTTEERIITAVHTENGAYTDGSNTNSLLKNTVASGLNVNEVYGDKAYFRKFILDEINAINAKPYIPVSHVVYRMDETKFNYNKDADEWTCQRGNSSVSRVRYITSSRGVPQSGYRYHFSEEQCQACPCRSECAGRRRHKVLNVGLNTGEFYEISQEQKNQTWVKKYYKRSGIEGKNAELKRFHGLNTARGYGLGSVSTQSKLAAIAVNIKRIARIIAAKNSTLMTNMVNFNLRLILY